MRSATAYFAGAGTVITAIAVGLGGGLMFANIVSPKTPKHAAETTHLERRMSREPIPVMAGSSEPVPNLAATPVLAAVAGTPAQPQPQQAASQQPQPPAPQPTPARAAETTQPAQSSPPTAPAIAQPVAVAEQPAVRERAAPEESLAKARESDLRRDARRAEEKRKAERRQQWAEKRRLRPRKDDELRDVERAVREETEPRQALAAQPARMEMPRIKLFGDD